MEGSANDDVAALRRGEFEDGVRAGGPRHALGELATLMRGAVPGAVVPLLFSTLGRMEMRPLSTVNAEVAPGRIMRFVNIPTLLCVMPSTCGKSNQARIFSRVLGLQEDGVAIPKRGTPWQDVVTYAIRKLWKKPIVAGTAEGIRDELESCMPRGTAVADTAVVVTAEADGLMSQMTEVPWFRDLVMRGWAGDIHSYVMASKRGKGTGPISSVWNLGVKPDTYCRVKRAMEGNGLCAKVVTLCVGQNARAGLVGR